MSEINEKGSDNVVVISSGAGKCGGTDATLDTGAPKTITSDKMTFFSVTSALGDNDELGYVSAFASEHAQGTFLFLEKSRGFSRRDERTCAWALVKGDVFPTLVNIVREYDLAKENGSHSFTHGLPENFGGSIDIWFDGGEKISVSNNQSPVISSAAGAAIAKAFDTVMKGKKAALPSVDILEKIEFYEERSGGFTRAALTIGPDGTAENERQSSYGDGKVYESRKKVDAETVASIKKTIKKCALFAWDGMPEKSFSVGNEKTLTFYFTGGGKKVAHGDAKVPDRLGGGFFDVELELATKN